MSKEIKSYWQNYINGQWVDGGAGCLNVDNPSTGELLAEMAVASAADVDAAVQAAKVCHLSNALTGPRPVERGRLVRAMGDWLQQHIDEIAQVLTLEAGKPLWESKIEIEGAIRYFEYYGNQAETVEGRSIPLGSDYYDFTVYEPFGVSAHIIPWNFPLEMIARSLSAALATGNACVIKTPELTPLASTYFAQAAEAAGLPAGAVNILCGYGAEAGSALTAHPDVNQIVFTGSVATGRHIATAAAQNLVPCVLELGGKSAAIVYPDADIESLMESVRWGIFFNAGQVCSAMSRLIVHESIHDEVMDALQTKIASQQQTQGIAATDINQTGAMVSFAQRDRAAGLCEQAVKEGARLVTGGNVPDLAGAFLQPTVFTGVTADMTIAQEEVFGPVLSGITFRDDAEAIAIANGTDYGLVGGVFTQDISRAMKAAQGIRAGQVFVNEWYAGGVETPFGGYGKSGYGREKGREALWNYVQTKNIAIRI